jgi:pimeloyl-ACP methyl ester carboxylesterase
VKQRRTEIYLALALLLVCLAGARPAMAGALAAAGTVAAAGATVPDGSRATLRRGSVSLRRCVPRRAYCARLSRPLDPAGEVSGSLPIYFEFYPHTAAGPAVGTLVATEGGPGYPATGSRDDYLSLFAPLMSDHDVLIMDNRGTGLSGALDCPGLQSADHWTVALIAACGASLGDRAPLYGTDYAADDLAAILTALGVAQIDLYGDSYGTYFEQAFAVRHPQLLRSVILDGAYPLTGPDYAWYPTYAPAMRDKFNLACARSAPCAALPGSSMDHLQPALTELRAAPFDAAARDVDGGQRLFRADAPHLAIVLFGGAPALTSLREADAAARAFESGDRAPLLRLMAETAAAVDSRDPAHEITKWSAGLAAAVMCQDPPQIFDMRLPPAERALDRDRALEDRRRRLPETYAPFTIDEYRAMPLDYSFLDECVGWPVASAHHPASQVGSGVRYPPVPALILSGEFDAITTPADGAAVAGLFGQGTQVRIANSFHVNALPRARSACAAQIARRFIRTLEVGDTGCAAQVPPLRLVGAFARQSNELPPASALAGNAASVRDLSRVAAAVLTAGDVLVRALENSSGRGAGLRGGTFRIRRDARGLHASLEEVRWTEDVAVSGTVDAPPGRDGPVRSVLEVAADGERGRLVATWPMMAAGSPARISGTMGGAAVRAQTPAP